MFDNKYFDWNAKRAKNIVDFYSYKFFYFKRVLDLGCGYGDLGGVLYRLGADVTGVDARQEHLKIVKKKYTGIKTVQANLDANWPFHGQKFDLILDLGLLCHLADYEKHLDAVCASCTHLVLETAVCDSDDPNKNIMIDEDKGTYDISYSGRGCRPSPAAIERVLRENGMNFKRIDNSKFNAADYSYDWYPTNDNSTSLQKRRIWFAVKESSPVQFQNPSSEIATAPINIRQAGQGHITPFRNNMPVTASPKPPMSARMEAEAKLRMIANPQASFPSPGPIFTHQKSLKLNDQVKYDSKDCALIEIDNFAAPIVSQIIATISPNTFASKMWYKKIAPLFPNIKLSKNILSMPNFAKSDKPPDVIMCNLNNLQAHNRVWIDEWSGNGLTNQHIEILTKCQIIITPSLLNAQEILKHIPNANILRVNRPWPLLDVAPADGDFYLYFEKSEELTKLLFDSWDNSSNLVVVGSSIKTPSFATFVSDAEPYVQIMKLIRGAKAIIDLSENNYYASGINKLANSINLPVLTNNVKFGNNITIIQQDKQQSIYPTIENIKQAMNKFNNLPQSKSSFVEAYNQTVIEDVRKIVGI